VFQAPQEAVMWLAAMNETTQFFFTVLTLSAWIRRRFYLAAVTFACALFSKESAVIIPLFVAVLDWYREGKPQWRRYALLAIPFAVFFAMLTNRSYAFGTQAVVVVAKSLHRLLWPWFYIILALTWIKTRVLPPWRVVGGYVAALAITMLPYMFIAYQTSVQSRQLYLASAVLVTLFATLLKPLRGSFLLNLVVLAFITFNIGYLWLRKDAQFEARAAPTTQLIAILKEHPPQRVVIRNFPYPYPEIAPAAALAAPGWDPSLILQDDTCDDCLEIEWHEQERRYTAAERR
jgi:hypothetical protein